MRGIPVYLVVFFLTIFALIFSVNRNVFMKDRDQLDDVFVDDVGDDEEPGHKPILDPNNKNQEPRQQIFRSQRTHSKPPDHFNYVASDPACVEFDLQPIVASGIGGSGTRGVARLLQLLGVYMGQSNTTLNKAYDLNQAMLGRDRIAEMMKKDHQVIPESTRTSLAFEGFINQTKELMYERDQLRKHYDDGQVDNVDNLPRPNCYWGFKEPNALYILPRLLAVFPNLTFVHIVRDGRDMAYSRNTAPMVQYFQSIFPGQRPKPSRNLPFNQIQLWSKINLDLNEWAKSHLSPERYIIVKSDDISHPNVTIRRNAIIEFANKLIPNFPKLEVTEEAVNDVSKPIFSHVMYKMLSKRKHGGAEQVEWGKWRRFPSTTIRNLENI